MVGDTGRPWKKTAIGMTVVVLTAVIAGLLAAGWGRAGLEALFSPVVPAPAVAPPRLVTQSPARDDVEACNQYAKAQAGDKAIEVVKEGTAADAGRAAGKGAVNGGMVSAAAGTLHGIDDREKNDARYVEAYRACMKGRGFSS